MKQFHNPFKFINDLEEDDNILWDLDNVDRRIEDIILGCIRSFSSESTHRQEVANWYKIYKLYRDVNKLSKESIQSYFRCSDRQANRYIQVIKLCNPFIKQHYRKYPHEL